MSNLITQNYYTTQTVTEVQASATGEISIQLLSAPIWEFWILLFGENDNMEEIFFHRRIWNTIYTYAINRSNPKTHSIWTNVVMNDSAWIFNYLSKNVYNHFYCYKESDTSVFVFWWLIFKEWIIEIQNKSLTISEWMNYIYLDDNFEIQVSSSSTNKYTVWLVTKSWSLINITKYNVLWFGRDWNDWKDGLDWKDGQDWKDGLDWKDGQDWKDGLDWKDGQDWTNGTNGTDWIDGKTIISASFNWDDIDFTMDDSSVVKLPNAKIDLKWDPGDIWEPWTNWQFISDIMPVNTSTHTVTTNGSTFIKITENATWNYVWYNLNGRVWASSSNEVSNYKVVAWTWGAVWSLQWITYTDWLTIDTDWTVRYTGQPAYRDKENEFSWVNTFNNTTIFKWDVSFMWYNWNTVNTVNFDASKWKKQIFNINNWWTKIVNFTNLNAWTNYEFFVNVSWSDTTLSFNWTTFTDCWTIAQVYAFGDSISWNSISLSAWDTYHFVATLWANAIHLSYTWYSRRVSINEIIN